MQPDAWDDVENALNDLDSPAEKEQIVAHASRRTQAEAALKLLRALPLGTYDNLPQVRRSVPLDPARGEGQTPSRKAEQQRSEHSHRIAEHLRDVEESPTRRRGGV